MSDDFSAWIVKPHSIHKSLVRNGPEKARRGIASLWMPGDSAEFGESKSQRRPGRDRFGRLVHACSQADRIWKIQSEKLDRQWRDSEKILQQIAGKLMPARMSQNPQGALMNRFGLLSEEHRTQEMPVNPIHGRLPHPFSTPGCRKMICGDASIHSLLPPTELPIMLASRHSQSKVSRCFATRCRQARFVAFSDNDPGNRGNATVYFFDKIEAGQRICEWRLHGADRKRIDVAQVK
jgi:hypothetical protein